MSRKNRGPVFDRVDAAGGAARGWRAKRAGKTDAAGTAAPEVAPTPTAPADGLFGLALEPRLLLDAAAVATGAEAIDDGTDTQAPVTAGDTTPDPKAAGDNLAAQVLADAAGAEADDIVFIDTGVDGWQTLADGVDPSAEVVLVGPNEDGMRVIADSLARFQQRGGVTS